MIRARLIRLSETQHVLIVTSHHIICDGWSLDVLNLEVAQLYEARRAGRPSPLRELSIQYADHAAWQRDYLKGEVLDSLLGYWRQKLADMAPLELPTDRARQSAADYKKARLPFYIPQRVKNRLSRICSEESVTPFMAVLAAFQVLLHRYTDSDDIAVGSMSANRGQSDIQGMIGLFINTLVMRNDLSGDPNFRSLLARVRQTAIEAFDHQQLRFELLAKELQPGHDPLKSPLLQVWFAFHQFGADEEDKLSGELIVESQGTNAAWEAAEDFDLTLGVEDEPDGFNCQFGYDANLFDKTTIVRMAEHFQTLLEAIVADPDQPISQLQLLTDREREQVLVEWNNTQVDYPQQRCVHQLVEAQARCVPDAVALVFEGQTMTYRELDAQANQLANYLTSLGVAPEVPVGICLEPSLELAVAIVGTLKAGGVYLPLDPEDPRERLNFFVADSRPAVLLSKSLWADRVAAPDSRIVHLDLEREVIAAQSTAHPISPVTPDHAMCVLYTSGSTGQPKGAVNLHRGICNYLLAKQEMIGLGADDRVLFTTPISFDTSVEEFFFGLMCGGCLVIEKGGGKQREMASMVRLIGREQITTACFVPSILRLLLEEDDLTACSSLKRVLVGGEVLTIDMVERFFQRLNADLYNEYGPTEASIDVAVWKAQLDYGRGIIPIGRPIANTRLYILDADKKPVPIGVPGELYIGGVAVARGYLNRPELNAQRFLPDPFSGVPGGTMYRTGDRSRWLPDGNIQFLGRRDGQVKIHGGRLELGEVEAAISRHPAVAHVAVAVRNLRPTTNTWRPMSCPAAVVPTVRVAPRIRKRPAAVSQDGRAGIHDSAGVRGTRLAAPTVERQGQSRARPAAAAPTAKPTQRVCRAANSARTAVDDNLGRCAAPRSCRPVRQLFRSGRSLPVGGATHLANAERAVNQLAALDTFHRPLWRSWPSRWWPCRPRAKSPICRRSNGSVATATLPVSYGQEALWVINQLQEGASPYVTFPAARVDGPLNVSVLEQALNEVLRRHESLRTTFKSVDGHPVQVITAAHAAAAGGRRSATPFA